MEAFKSAEADNEWIFAEGLPTEVDLKLLYACEGTLWTDMKNVGVRANLDIKQPDSQKQGGE